MELRPRTPFEVLDLSARLVREEAGRFGRLAALLLLPAWAVLWAVSWGLEQPWVAVIAALLVGPLLQLPFTVLGASLLFAPDVPVRDALTLDRPRLAALGTTWVGTRLVVVVALLSMGLLALPIWVMVMFVRETLALERVPLGDALRRSATLATEHLGKALSGGLVMILVWTWTVVAAETTGQALTGSVLQLGAPFGSVLTGDVTPWLLGGLLLAQPALAIYRLLLYVDIRTTLEGWDLQVALKAAAEDA